MPSTPSFTLFAHHALTPDGWRDNLLLTVENGLITALTPATPPDHSQTTVLLPGMANVHSHAFQRAMAGLTEQLSRQADNFWSWREVMYRFVQRLTPETVEAIAHWLYIELLKGGYTAVTEFHYLHHPAGGRRYDDPTELSGRVIAAAQAAGIFQLHAPVLYMTSEFGGQPAHAGQQRFVHTVESYLSLLDALKRFSALPNLALGVAPHSLRAVPPEALAAVLNALPGLGLEHAPIHMHIAEQVKEVEACLAWSGQRPMAWLLDHAPVDPRWCLIHATHLDARETERLAHSSAVAGLCPSTEANLGDGIFPAVAFLKAGGRLALGSDSHVAVSPFEELKLLEYSQRLTHRQRTLLAGADQPSTGTHLYRMAAKHGAQALGIPSGEIAVGARADLIALDTTHPLYAYKTPEEILDTAIFGLTPTVRDVWVGGTHIIRDGHHPQETQAAQTFRQALNYLLTDA